MSDSTEHERDEERSGSVDEATMVLPGRAVVPAPAAPTGETVPGEAVTGEAATTAAVPGEALAEPGSDPVGGRPSRRSVSGASMVIALLLALLGFTLVVQLKSNSTDAQYAALREDDLTTILSDLGSRQVRLQQDIASLDAQKRELALGAAGREAALAQARERADDLGILAGTLPARGPGLTVQFVDGGKRITALDLLDAVQELRGAGAEALQIDASGRSARIIASTYFVETEHGIDVGGVVMKGPYTITAIGDPLAMGPALNIQGGVIATVTSHDGNVIVSAPGVVDVKTTSPPPNLEYAEPVA